MSKPACSKWACCIKRVYSPAYINCIEGYAITMYMSTFQIKRSVYLIIEMSGSPPVSSSAGTTTQQQQSNASGNIPGCILFQGALKPYQALFDKLPKIFTTNTSFFKLPISIFSALYTFIFLRFLIFSLILFSILPFLLRNKEPYSTLVI